MQEKWLPEKNTSKTGNMKMALWQKQDQAAPKALGVCAAMAQ